MEGKGIKKWFPGVWLWGIFLCCMIGSDAIGYPLPENEKCWIFFKNKKGSQLDPFAYFDPLAIQRRIKAGIALCDSTDFPVPDAYLQAIRGLADSVGHCSRWFNAVAAWISPGQKMHIEALPFVRKISPMPHGSAIPATNRPGKQGEELSMAEEALLKRQTQQMEGDLFREAGLDGTGIRIAILDAGFPGVETLPAFGHIRNRQHIRATYDFVRNRDFVYTRNSHGTMVLSCIAGMKDSIPIGLATGAEFLLAITENPSREPFSEEENWLAAIEWADRHGAHIVNSSLGYTYQRYFPEDMNGYTSLISRAANIAAAKGILVVNAAGNEGNRRWKTIGCPADADSVLTVAGIDPKTNYKSDFSSFGPTADGRRKPNVAAYGTVIAEGRRGPVKVDGTSFASPLVAGFAACTWQSDSMLTNMQLFRQVEESGHLYPYFDYAHGYGVPQASVILGKAPLPAPTFNLEETGTGFLKVRIITPGFAADSVSNPGSGPQNPSAFSDDATDQAAPHGPYLYYHVAGKNGEIRKYAVIRVHHADAWLFKMSVFSPGDVLSVHFDGYTLTYIFQ